MGLLHRKFKILGFYLEAYIPNDLHRSYAGGMYANPNFQQGLS